MTSAASTTRADSLTSRMESIEIAGTSLVVSRIGLGNSRNLQDQAFPSP